MAKVLYITAHPHDDTQSYSMAVGKAFIDTYKEVNPQDEVVHVDLYKEHIPHIDADVFSGWGKLQTGKGFEELSEEEKGKAGQGCSRRQRCAQEAVDGCLYGHVGHLLCRCTRGLHSVVARAEYLRFLSLVEGQLGSASWIRVGI